MRISASKSRAKGWLTAAAARVAFISGYVVELGELVVWVYASIFHAVFCFNFLKTFAFFWCKVVVAISGYVSEKKAVFSVFFLTFFKNHI